MEEIALLEIKFVTFTFIAYFSFNVYIHKSLSVNERYLYCKLDIKLDENKKGKVMKLNTRFAKVLFCLKPAHFLLQT